MLTTPNVPSIEVKTPPPLSTTQLPSGNGLTEWMLNSGSMEQASDLLLQTWKLLANTIQTADTPFSGILPHELNKTIADIDLNKPLSGMDEALKELQSIYLNDAVYYHHPKYLAHLNCPIALSGLMGDIIASTINTAVETWDQSAGGTLIEQKVIVWITARIGFDNNADGVFTSGGSQSNLMGLLLARDTACERHFNELAKQGGLSPQAQRFKIFTSEVSHFSVKKSAALLGLGYDAVETVPTDAYFCINLDILDERIKKTKEQGQIPIAVVATAGTTDLGSIDPLENIAELCQQHKLWMHADAAYGGGLLMTKEYASRLKGIHLADSVTIDFHKTFFQPVSCSAFLVRDSKTLSPVTYYADYLNPLHHVEAGIPNAVDKSLQTTRRFDALKLWMTLRADGANAIGRALEQSIKLAYNTYLACLEDPLIEAVHRPELSTIVFRFRPCQSDDNKKLSRINQTIRDIIARSGQALVAGTTIKGNTYLKFTILNPATTQKDTLAMIDKVKQLGLTLY